MTETNVSEWLFLIALFLRQAHRVGAPDGVGQP